MALHQRRPFKGVAVRGTNAPSGGNKCQKDPKRYDGVFIMKIIQGFSFHQVELQPHGPAVLRLNCVGVQELTETSSVIPLKLDTGF